MQSPLLIFKSSLFAVWPGEDNDTNPDLFGEALAHWLGQRLVSPSFSLEDVIAEDFGWCVRIPNEQMSVYVACCSVEGSHVEWQCFVFAEGGLVGRLLGRVNPSVIVGEVFANLKRTLQGTSGITELREEQL